MEREGRVGKFLERNRLNIVGRSLAAISIAAAGVAAVEGAASFDLLPNPVESANHLVLNNLHNSYKQLIDKSSPKVEKAEAAQPLTIVSNLTRRPADDINGTVAYFDFDYTTHLVLASFVEAPGWSCRPVGPDVALPNESNKFNCSTYCTPHNPVPAIGGALKIAFFNTSKDLHFTAQFWGRRPTGAGAEAQEGSTAGSCSGGVGGIAELPDVKGLPQNMNSEKSKDYTTPIAAGVAAVAAAVATTGAVLYSRRNRSVR